jgi:hypothetical protein
VHRLSMDAGTGAIIRRRHDFPDILVESDGVRLGVEIKWSNSSSFIFGSREIQRARAVAHADGLSEVALLFATEDARVAGAIGDRFAEESFLGTAVTAIVVHARKGDMRVLLNQSANRLLQHAFPVD